MGEESLLGFWKRILVFEVNGDTDPIELLYHISQMEREEVSHCRSRNLLKSLTRG